MRPSLIRTTFGLLLLLSLQGMAPLAAAAPMNFVVQLTRSGEHFRQRRVFLQLDKILDDIGEDKVKFTVVAYEDGIKALLTDNQETSQLLTKLANRGVTFEACRISMRAWGLTESQFPMEVNFVPAGAPEVIRLQLKGYKYWRP